MRKFARHNAKKIAGERGRGYGRIVFIVSLYTVIITLILLFLRRDDVQQHISLISNKQTWITRLLFSTEQDTETEFRKQWSRMLKARVDWKGILAPCTGQMQLSETLPGWGKVNETSSNESFVKFTDIRPAGQFSRIFIQTRTNDGMDKTIGGDFWKVTLSGPASISATVFDHLNGTYEALVLLMDPGNYSVNAIVQRSLCKGLKEPPKHFLRLLNSGATIAHLGQDKTAFGRLKGSIMVYVPPTNDDVDKRLKDVSDITCETSCRSVWNGHGRWIGDNWVPFLRSDNHNLTQLLKNRRKNTEQTVYIVGDSVSHGFSGEYFGYNNVCSIVFKRCVKDQFHLYPLSHDLHPKAIAFLLNKTNGKLKSRFNKGVVLDSLREIFREADMKHKRSLMVLNFGLHFARKVKFPTFQLFMKDLITLLGNRTKLFGSNSRVVWRTTTATNFKEEFGRIDGWFLTSSRSRLYDAYALSEMCKAGIEILDWYPTSASTIKGQRDRVHFNAKVFSKVMDALTWYSISEPEKRSRDICFG